MRRVTLSLAICLAAAGVCRGEGEAGAQFLAIGVGARACAMGEAFGAMADDPSAVHWNPAGLSRSNRPRVLLSQNFWLLDMGYQYLAAAMPAGPGNLGGSLAYSSSGDIPRVEHFRRTGEYSAYDAALALAYAAEVGPGLAAGCSGKWIYQRIEEHSASSLALDLGLIFAIPARPCWRLGVSVHHLGPDMEFITDGDPLPRTVRLAAAYHGSDLTLAAQTEKAAGSAAVAGLGAEYVLMDVLALRGGYHTVRSWSAGLGVRWRNIGLDAAYIVNEHIEATQMFSLELLL